MRIPDRFHQWCKLPTSCGTASTCHIWRRIEMISPAWAKTSCTDSFLQGETHRRSKGLGEEVSPRLHIKTASIISDSSLMCHDLEVKKSLSSNFSSTVRHLGLPWKGCYSQYFVTRGFTGMGSTECGAEGLNKVEGLLFQCVLRSNVIMDFKMKR